MSAVKRFSVDSFSRVHPLHPEYIDLGPLPQTPTQKYSSQISEPSLLSTATSTNSPGRSSEQLLTGHHDDLPWHTENGTLTDALPSTKGNDRSGMQWPLGVKLALFLVAMILFVNSAVILWASVTNNLDRGIGTLYRDHCDKVTRAGQYTHALINIIGTLLLGASNFTMQCLNSPTREEVNRAHAKKQWLEIGTLSVRNLSYIGRIRLLLWTVLGLSSVPLHLMYNSAFFVSLTANKYMIAVVTEPFVQGGSWQLSSNDNTHFAILTEIQADTIAYQRLDPEACIRAYGIDFISNRRHVVLVTKLNTTEENTSNSLLGTLDWAYDGTQNPWLCGLNVSPARSMVLEPWGAADSSCNIATALEFMDKNDGHILFAHHELEYCLSESVLDECRMEFSLLILLVFIGCNVTIMLCVLLTLMGPFKALITLGDAVASFLEYPDPTTRGMCTVAVDDINSGYWPDAPEPRQWRCVRYLRWQAAGQRRWEGCCIFSLTVLGALGTLLWVAIKTTTANRNATTWHNAGFGVATEASKVQWPPSHIGRPADILRNALLANLPQLLLSALYLTWNRVLTCMAFATEWCSFSSSRQALRVTTSRGMQYKTKFLTLPWRYMVLLLVSSAAVHFLMSQAFFLVAIDVYGFDGVPVPEDSITSVGFSILAFVILLGVLTFLLSVSVGMGYLRYKGGMPLVGVSSMGISAACHVGYGEDGAEVSRRGVRWGVICTEAGIGHLGFTSGWVGEPVPRRLYA